MRLRPIGREDFPAVARLWSALLAGGRTHDAAGAPETETLRPETLEMYGRLAPSASLVAEEGREPVAFAFARVWGRTAWIGPLFVTPERQGKGLGRALVDSVVQALASEGAATIGIESDPAGARELGFLARCGFRPSGLVLELEKVLPAEAGPPPAAGEDGDGLRFLGGLLPDERAPWLEGARRLSAAQDADLDLSPETALLEEYGFGDTVFAGRPGEPAGMALCESRFATTVSDDVLRVRALVLAEPEPFRSLDLLLSGIDAYARESRMRRVRVHAPVRSWDGCRALLDRGFRITRTGLRLHRVGYPEKGEGRMINFARWG